jgi:predicted signal transduction protein with EAL and GGDEF domain
MGAATGPDQGRDPETLLQNAETALLAAVGDDTGYALYETEQHTEATDSLRLDIELELAIKRGEFELYYQPKIATRDFMPCGAEALIRWQSPVRGFVSPEVFIPLADRTGRMEPLTSFVLNAALKQASQWPQSLSVSINMSPKITRSLCWTGLSICTRKKIIGQRNIIGNCE